MFRFASIFLRTCSHSLKCIVRARTQTHTHARSHHTGYCCTYKMHEGWLHCYRSVREPGEDEHARAHCRWFISFDARNSIMFQLHLNVCEHAHTRTNGRSHSASLSRSTLRQYASRAMALVFWEAIDQIDTLVVSWSRRCSQANKMLCQSEA